MPKTRRIIVAIVKNENNSLQPYNAMTNPPKNEPRTGAIVITKP